jgi:hypothetical protein
MSWFKNMFEPPESGKDRKGDFVAYEGPSDGVDGDVETAIKTLMNYAMNGYGAKGEGRVTNGVREVGESMRLEIKGIECEVREGGEVSRTKNVGDYEIIVKRVR